MLRRRFICHVLTSLTTSLLVVTPALGQGGPGRPGELRCEYKVNPLGIDVVKPRLSWQVNDPRRGAVQSAYQILVASAPAKLSEAGVDVFNSGKVASNQSHLVVYNGPAVQSRRRYYWTVRTWDAAGVASPWAEPAWWETGLLAADDWKAEWITAPHHPRPEEPPSQGDWIWSSTVTDEQTIFLREIVELDKDVAGAIARVAADDQYRFFVNGRDFGKGIGWQLFNDYDITATLRPGRNVIAIEATNHVGHAGVAATIRIRYADGRIVDVQTGPDWQVIDKAPPHWNEPSAGTAKGDWQPATVIGKLGDEPLGMPDVRQSQLRSLLVRNEFILADAPTRARLYVSGLGLYVAHINGKRVGHDYFTPGWTDYPKHVQYQTYDVTQVVHKGNNAIGAILGNGWWSGGLGWMGGHTYAHGNLRFIAQLEVTQADGSQQLIATHDGWRWHAAPITRNSFYHGETYEATLAQPGWDEPDFDDRGWTRCEPADGPPIDHLVAQVAPTIQVTATRKVEQITSPKPGVYIFDFGQNLAGIARLKVRGATRGEKISIRFAEILNPDGTIYRENYRSAEATDVYIAAGKPVEVWQPTFTYRGFRYAELTGYPGTPAPDALTSLAVHTNAPPAGTFVCSNDLLNHILQNIRWGQRSNMESVPTDCPQRDERLGWMGDAQTFAPTSCWNMEMASFYTKWMRDILDSQYANGAVTNVAPVIVVTGAAAPGWGDAVTIIPWTVYRFYGDTRIIETSYDGMKRWVEYMRGASKRNLYEPGGYGDWIAQAESPKEPIGTAYYYYSTKLLSQMAAVIGRDEDASEYAKLADRIAAAYNAEYLGRITNNYAGRTQTANILPTWFGLTPPARVNAVVRNIVDDIKKRGMHLSTGFLGTPYLLPLLAKYGYQNIAYALATQTTFPSWGYMIGHGATTIWELWDSDKKGPEMNSRNHFALGAVGEWMYEELAGIHPDPEHPGFARIIIRPRPPEGLDWVQCTYPSPYGQIQSDWRRTQTGLQMHVVIPANTTARVYVPDGAASGVDVLESDKMLLSDGVPAEGESGSAFEGITGGAAVFTIGAGDYQFDVRRR